ncbi:MAG: 4a-hydroxytetrahydrobiopterin dehydratase [Candidatus Doudnabacteria bacterium]|nr:4a-hydroxytetrahydrobiopterin dehydratase [Candidatus Doudnabacteria bacterium]
MQLREKICVPCAAGTPPLKRQEIEKLLKQLPSGWEAIEDPAAPGGTSKKIRKTFKFKNYPDTLAFVNRAALIAQEEGHHPDMEVHWGKVVVELWTHKINGLSENDFILAAKIDS